MRDFDFRKEGSKPNNDKLAVSRRADYGMDTMAEFQVSYTPVRAGIFNIYLFGLIEDASQFIQAIEVLNAAGENDTVNIHLSTPGGSLDATDTFVSAMRNSAGSVAVHASGGVHSAGTIILLNSSEFYLSENFNCLIHNGSAGTGGKFSDFKTQNKHTERYMDTVLRRTYAGFLSPDEINALIDGKDFWFNAQEFVTRFDNRIEMMRVAIEAAQAEAVKMITDLDSEAEEEKLAPPKLKKLRKKVVVPDE
jgi:ATP-dependent protease ClpP protease subunit